MDDSTEKESSIQSRRNRIGQVILLIGIITLTTGVLSSITVSILAGIGVILTNPNYQILDMMALAGLALTVIGILLKYASPNFSEDSLWALQTGPYVK